MNGRVVAALRWSLGVAALAFLLWRVDLGSALATVREADPRWLAAALVAQLGAKTCWVLRWRRLLAATGHPRGAGSLLRLILLGLFFNNFLPTSVGGDVVRGIGLARDGVPKALAAASVVADRLVGVVALALLAAGGGLVGARLWPDGGPWTASAVVAAVVGTGIVVATRPEVLGRLGAIGPSGPLVAKGRRLVEKISFLSGQAAALAVALGFSVALAACSAIYHWTVARAVGIDLPAVSWFVIVPAVMLFAALPITVNGLGVRELGFVGFLSAQGVDGERATVFALLAFVGTLGFAVAGGLLFLRGDRPTTEAKHV
ncbi:MAG: lysylphosphatidylglycerol synthase transmembrane domain-containing protein [bacterium]